MTINERFERIINTLYNGNKRAFATSIGVSATVVENVVGKRRGKPSYDVLVAICACADISAHWLLTGEGDMLVKGVSVEQNNVVGDNINGHNVTVGKSSDDYMQVIKQQSLQLSRSQEQLSSSQEQINRLITLLEKMSGSRE